MGRSYLSDLKQDIQGKLVQNSTRAERHPVSKGKWRPGGFDMTPTAIPRVMYINQSDLPLDRAKSDFHSSQVSRSSFS